MAPISDEMLADACRRLGVTDPIRRDFNGRTTHAIVTTAHGSKAWLKVGGVVRNTRDACRQAEIEAEGLSNLRKPGIMAVSEWKKSGISWRGVLMTIAPSDAAADSPLHAPPSSSVPERWWDELRDALQAVRRIRTSRFIYSPSEIADLIRTYLPSGFPTHADAWCVQHGDLHWSNLTLPHLMLLDWEVWGQAPVGYGAGRLLVVSLLSPDIAAKVEQSFADEFSTASGRVGVLAAIAVMKRQIEAGGVTRDLEPCIHVLLDRIRKDEFGGRRMPPARRA